jgi:hypothetical protein
MNDIWQKTVVECEGGLFENLDALVAVAEQEPNYFLGNIGVERHDVEVSLDEENNLLVITWSYEEWDDDGKSILEPEKAEFEHIHRTLYTRP